MTDHTTPMLCGTYAGYNRHIKVTRDEPCDDCKAANALYVRLYRQRPGVRQRVAKHQRAADRAKARLARMHPNEYRALYREELDRD
jgi:type VI protein secretion system component VasF